MSSVVLLWYPEALLNSFEQEEGEGEARGLAIFCLKLSKLQLQNCGWRQGCRDDSHASAQLFWSSYASEVEAGLAVNPV